MTSIIIATIVGAGLVTGLLFAFSNFVIRALSELPNDHGMFAMQQINERIINPIFMVLFLGTPLLCVVIAIRSFLNLETSADLLLLSGSISYLIGPFGVTLFFNVPLNNRLAGSAPCAADQIWPDYQIRWQRWNHVRTIVGVVSILLLTTGLGFSTA